MARDPAARREIHAARRRAGPAGREVPRRAAPPARVPLDPAAAADRELQPLQTLPPAHRYGVTSVLCIPGDGRRCCRATCS